MGTVDYSKKFINFLCNLGESIFLIKISMLWFRWKSRAIIPTLVYYSESLSYPRKEVEQPKPFFKFTSFFFHNYIIKHCKIEVKKKIG